MNNRINRIIFAFVAALTLGFASASAQEAPTSGQKLVHKVPILADIKLYHGQRARAFASNHCRRNPATYQDLLDRASQDANADSLAVEWAELEYRCLYAHLGAVDTIAGTASTDTLDIKRAAERLADHIEGAVDWITATTGGSLGGYAPFGVGVPQADTVERETGPELVARIKRERAPFQDAISDLEPLAGVSTHIAPLPGMTPISSEKVMLRGLAPYSTCHIAIGMLRDIPVENRRVGVICVMYVPVPQEPDPEPVPLGGLAPFGAPCTIEDWRWEYHASVNAVEVDGVIDRFPLQYEKIYLTLRDGPAEDRRYLGRDWTFIDPDGGFKEYVNVSFAPQGSLNLSYRCDVR